MALGQSDLRFFLTSVFAVCQQVVGMSSTHDASTGKDECHSTGVDGYPTTAPFFGNVSGSTRTASRDPRPNPLGRSSSGCNEGWV